MMRLLALSLAVLALCAPGAAAQTYVGVLEDQPGRRTGETHRNVLRVAFVADGGAWRAADDDAAPATWTIGFDGRALGRVDSRPLASSYLADRGLRSVDANSTVPRIGAPREEFSGWLWTPVQRPLVATSSDAVADPEHWQPALQDAATIRAVRRAFRSRFPVVENCADPYENVARPWSFRDGAITVERNYRAISGWQVISVTLDGYNCDGPIDDPDDSPSPFLDQVFAVSPAGGVRLLGEGIWLVDAGDYDNDGVSELVFAIDRYNEGGYELFSAVFTTHAVFSYGYH